MGSTRTRASAGRNERADIAFIVAALKKKTPAGIKIINRFYEKTGFHILDARTRAGNRGVHYDFEIFITTSETELPVWKRVEHKGSRTAIPIPPEQTPWAAGVQFHNGGCNKYSIGHLYAKKWYEIHVGSGALKTEWSLEAPIPTFDEWFTKDAKRQDDPATEFGKELKKKVRGVRGPKASLGEKRKVVNDIFEPSADELETFKSEVLAILNESLVQKEYWLTIHGSLEGEFFCEWYPNFTIPEIVSVRMRKELDIWFDFECPAATNFSCILRWGKGAGFSNLRIDARDTV